MGRESWAIGVVLAAPIVVMILVWGFSVGNPMDYLTHSLPPGQFLYVLSKLAGLIAFALMWMQALLAMAKRTRLLHSFPRLSLKGHMTLGAVTLSACLLHLGLFFSAVWLREGEAPWALLVPRFTEGYYQLHIAMGLVGFLLLAVAVFSGWKARGGSSHWRKLHMLWIFVFVLVFWHALGIGSESRYGAMLYVWWFAAASIGATVGSRLYARWRCHRATRSGSRRGFSRDGLMLDTDPRHLDQDA